MTNLFIKFSSGCDYQQSDATIALADNSMQEPGWSDSIIVEQSPGLTLAGRH